jgi:chemotaxis protein MotB
LKNSTNSDLNHVYSVLRERYSGKQVDVVGHTDTDPIRKTKNLWKDNWDLSAGRALTVVRYLVDKGVSPKNIRGVACGQSRPVASNSSSAGKAKNRRVEIVVHM